MRHGPAHTCRSAVETLAPHEVVPAADQLHHHLRYRDAACLCERVRRRLPEVDVVLVVRDGFRRRWTALIAPMPWANDLPA